MIRNRVATDQADGPKPLGDLAVPGLCFQVHRLNPYTDSALRPGDIGMVLPGASGKTDVPLRAPRRHSLSGRETTAVYQVQFLVWIPARSLLLWSDDGPGCGYRGVHVTPITRLTIEYAETT